MVRTLLMPTVSAGMPTEHFTHLNAYQPGFQFHRSTATIGVTIGRGFVNIGDGYFAITGQGVAWREC
jgi:hypothetical protein